MLWLALQFPHLGLEVFDVPPEEDEGAHGKITAPTVLLEHNRVVIRNAAAVQAGIQSGATLATAHSICAGLKSLQRDETREHERLRMLAEILYRFSAEVSVEPPDGLLIEVSRSLRLFGDVEALAAEAVEVCAALGHRVRHHVAATPLAAMVMARAAVPLLEEVPLTRAGLPDAVTLVERFANMGIHRLGPLLELPEDELGQRFGPGLLGFLDRLTGRIPDPRPSIRPAPDFRRSRHLLEPIRDKQALLFPMQRLLDELAQWLIGRQLGAGRLLWRFADHSGQGAVTLPVHFAAAEQSRRVFLNITRLKLDRTELPEDILSIGLEAQRLKAWQGASRGLFRFLPGPESAGLGSTGAQAAELAGLLDELCARLGRGACRGISIQDQHAPELAWLPVSARPPVRPPVRPAARGAGRKASVATSASTALFPQTEALTYPRPLWLFDLPCPVERCRFTLLRGPERIETAWWQQTVARDYFVARHDNGAECWVFTDSSERWYLHGYFA